MQLNDSSQDRLSIMFTFSRGANSRKRILELLVNVPMNCNQVSKALQLDWWTVQKHLQFLTAENLIAAIIFGRMTLYKVTPYGKRALALIANGDDTKQCAVSIEK